MPWFRHAALCCATLCCAVAGPAVCGHAALWPAAGRTCCSADPAWPSCQGKVWMTWGRSIGGIMALICSLGSPWASTALAAICSSPTQPPTT